MAVGPLLTSNSPVRIGGLPIVNSLANPNTFASGAPANPQPPGGHFSANTPAKLGSFPQTPAKPTPTPTLTAAQIAQAAAQTKYNQNLGAFNTTTKGTISAQGKVYGADISDYFDSAGGAASQQRTINADAVQNELSKDQGMQGVTDMVNNGIQGGGIILDNDNAGTSSAADALARAYGIQGRQQASGVGNQYAQGQNTIANDQTNLNDAVAHFTKVDAPEDKSNIINSITSSAYQSLTYLNALASSAGVQNLPSIQQQIAQVKAQATAALSAYDNEISKGQNEVKPTSQSANQAEAQKRFAEGVAPAQEFNYTATAPATLQGTGPAASDLPIYIGAPNKNNNTSTPVTA